MGLALVIRAYWSAALFWIDQKYIFDPALRNKGLCIYPQAY